MTDTTTRQRWQTESLRVTVFRSQPGTPFDGRGWWKTVTGDEPENHVESPRLNAMREDGPFLGGRLSLGIDPGRVDWVLAVEPDPEGTTVGLGLIDECIERLTKALSEWFRLAPPAQRLAVGVTGVIRVPDRVAGYRLLQGFVHDVKLDPENTSDFSYQINKPRLSKVVPPLKINRLSKWSVLASRALQLMVAGGSPTAVTGPERFACRVELDINTAAEHQGEVPTRDILPELFRLALEIGERGDIP